MKIKSICRNQCQLLVYGYLQLHYKCPVAIGWLQTMSTLHFTSTVRQFDVMII